MVNVVLNTMTAGNSGCGVTTSGVANYIIDAVNTTTLTAASIYTLSVSFGTDANQYFGAWIDYNNDGTPESISYDRLSVFLAISIKEFRNQLRVSIFATGPIK